MRHLVRNGVKLAYEEAGAGGPPLLLVHGMRCNRSHMYPQLGHFMRRHRVVAIDVRGQGESDAPVNAMAERFLELLPASP